MTGSHPEKIDKYVITDLLGEGAMGVVYRAMDSVLQRYVAVKVMTTGIARDQDLRERFLREARAAGSLQHPNIVTIYDFGEVGDQLFIAMQYIEGADLTDIISQQQQLPLHAKLDIIIDILNGLAYAHRRGVIHRDIKPANIRISSEGRAHIMDFGIARLSESSMTRSGVLIGTPDYMSPEQVQGAELTPASDIFAVGTVLYELLTNTKPFKAETLHSVMYRIVSENPRPIQDVIPGLPPALQNIVSKALAKKVERRYSNAEAMSEDLTAFRLALSGGSTATITVRKTPLLNAPLEEAQPPAAQRPRYAPFVAAATLGVALIAGTLVWRGRRSEGSATPARQAAEPLPAPTAPVPSTAAPVAPERSATLVGTADRADRVRNDSTLSAVRVAALETRRRAADAGATAAELLYGAKLLRSGDEAARKSRVPEAMSRYASASAAWLDVERTAAMRATASRTAIAAAQPPAPTPPPPAPAVVAAAPTVEKPLAREPDPVDQRREIEALIAAFAKALESMSIPELRRAYPGMTPAQQSGWEQFFASVKGLQADLTVSQMEVSGPAAELRVTGTYTYEGRGGKRDRQPVSFVAIARRDASGWRLDAIR